MQLPLKLSLAALTFIASVTAQSPPPIGVPHVALADGPFTFDTAEQHKIRVTVVTRGLVHPWSLAFLPDGGMLVTERSGRLRIVRDGVLRPEPLTGVPAVHAVGSSGLLDLALHPKFAENKLVYFTYTKPGEGGKFATTVAHARLTDTGLADVKDIFAGEWNNLTGGSRLAFGPDGTLYMTLSATSGNAAQDPASDYGKILRLRDDGSVPDDNPFVHRAGYKPEIFSLGHRDQLGLTFRPGTTELYSSENGPNGGDKINQVLPGRNYGWPVVSYGRTNPGPRLSEVPWQQGFEVPFVVWVPSIAPSGLTFYSGSQFPAWKGNLFVGGMRYGELPVTGRLERVVFNDKMEEIRRESLLTDLKQRIRDVRQGPDGFLYVLTEEEDGAILRIEPAR